MAELTVAAKKKMIAELRKASKTHAKQAKILSSVKLKKGGKAKSRVNEAGNYTKPTMRKRLFNRIKAGSKGGKPGQWSARKAQLVAQKYKAAGGGYKGGKGKKQKDLKRWGKEKWMTRKEYEKKKKD